MINVTASKLLNCRDINLRTGLDFIATTTHSIQKILPSFTEEDLVKDAMYINDIFEVIVRPSHSELEKHNTKYYIKKLRKIKTNVKGFKLLDVGSQETKEGIIIHMHYEFV